MIQLMKNLVNLNSMIAILVMAAMFNTVAGAAGTVKPRVLFSGDLREMVTFEKMELEGAFNVTLIHGNEESVVVIATDKIRSQILTKVENGSLHIHTDKQFRSNEKNLLTVYF